MKQAARILLSVVIFLSVGLAVLQPAGGGDVLTGQQGRTFGRSLGEPPKPAEFELYVSEPVTPFLSPAVRDLPVYEPEYWLDREINPRLSLNVIPDELLDYQGGLPGGVDSLLALQQNAPQATADGFTTPILNFAGQGFTGVNPPDTVGEVGPDYYIQVINSGGGGVFRVYNKENGSSVAGPFAIDSLAFGTGSCASGYGDGIVLYDQLAGRWMLSEFASSGNHLCVYISQTSDPLGSWWGYDFATPNFPDYPKYAVWPDAYYVSTNENSSAAYALERAKMLAGQAATMQRITIADLAGFSFQALIPSDLDGATPPPAGTPNYFMRHRDDEVHNPGSNNPSQDYLEIWQFHVDWTTPANSSFTGPYNVPIAEIDSHLCGLTSFFCFPQQGSSTTLDPLREVVMWRLQYRNFGTHQTLVSNLVTDVDSTDHGGIRWFELRKSAGNWGLFQEGTYAPDAHSRWMGSAAMDGSGNIAVGYSVSSSSMYPSIRYAGRLASDPLGTLPYGEVAMAAGSAANSSNRWGDYSSMNVDPVDDCTFWYTNMYNQTSQWSTRIAKFRFDACGAADFTLGATPESQAVCIPDQAIYTVNVGQVNGFTDPVTLNVTGAPVGTTTSFDPNPVTPPGSSELTLTVGGGTAAGAYSLNVVGVAPTSTHTTTIGLDVYSAAPGAVTLLAPANGALNVAPRPTFEWTTAAQADAYLLEVATDMLFNNVVYSTVTAGTSHMPDSDLATSTTYYWRVRASNPCGNGSFSAVYSFTTQAQPGDCGPGTAPVALFSDDFESGAAGWTTSGTGSPWALSTARPYAGAYAYHASDVSSVTDQRLTSPAVALPAGDSPLTLQYWNHQTIEDSIGGCYDGGILEISTNGGSSWTQLDAQLLTDPYDGVVSSSYGNPLAGLDAWCGDPQDWTRSVVDLDGYAGQTVQFRFRLGTDSSLGGEGWYLDDVVVQSCQPTGPQPAITLDVTVGTDPATCSALDQVTLPAGGGQATFCYQVTNTGGVTLTLHDLDDTVIGSVLNGLTYSLAPTDSVWVTQTVQMNATEVNTAVWTAYNPGPADVTQAADSATVLVPPLPPVLTSPPDGAILTDQTPLLTWDASVGAAGYLLDLNGAVMDVGNVTQYQTAILPYGPHAWSVAAYEGVGTTGPYAVPWTFTVAYQVYLPLVLR